VADREPEEFVVRDWFDRAGGAVFVTGEGPVTVLVPGRRNGDHGADIADAVLATRRGLVMGDIEVHTLSSGWWAHGHQGDPAYNRVILHVVRRHDAGRDAVLQNGRTVPTLTLVPDIISSPPLPALALPDTAAFLPCRREGRAPEETESILDGLGQVRFEARAVDFGHDLLDTGADEVLYRGIAAGLGYLRNRDPMRRLAERLPLAELHGIMSGGRASRIVAAEAWLIGAAGLLPSQPTRRDGGRAELPEVRRLEAAWRAHGSPALLAENEWHHARVRPGNYPARRLAALARLAARYGQDVFTEGLLGGLAAAPGPRAMAALVTVPAEGFWREWLDFGRAACRNAPALCGPGRAADIVVNVLLPFAAAWYRRNGYAAGEREALAAYEAHPALADNTIVEEVRDRLGLPRPKTAVRQQGMLELHRRWCAPGNCRTCPLVA
jgi:hypothetical protein